MKLDRERCLKEFGSMIPTILSSSESKSLKVHCVQWIAELTDTPFHIPAIRYSDFLKGSRGVVFFLLFSMYVLYECGRRQSSFTIPPICLPISGTTSHRLSHLTRTHVQVLKKRFIAANKARIENEKVKSRLIEHSIDLKKQYVKEAKESAKDLFLYMRKKRLFPEQQQLQQEKEQQYALMRHQGPSSSVPLSSPNAPVTPTNFQYSSHSHHNPHHVDASLSFPSPSNNPSPGSCSSFQPGGPSTRVLLKSPINSTSYVIQQPPTTLGTIAMCSNALNNINESLVLLGAEVAVQREEMWKFTQKVNKSLEVKKSLADGSDNSESAALEFPDKGEEEK
ncbi:hypothetical protein ADUPG1_009709, partial [Aduncisulcus paluster]